MMDDFAIKGIREGLLLTLKSDDEWLALMGRLGVKIDEQKNFFRGARVALDVGSRPVRRHELDSLKMTLERRDMTLWAVLSNSPTTQDTARNMGLETTLVTGDQDQLEAPEFKPEEVGDPGVFINHTVRNGRTIRSAGHVIVYGDVNPGATIIAAGNVIVWGRLRGMVHAGANGDESAVVCALDLAPTQLRIAGYITIPPEDKRRKPRPETASVRGGRIIAEAWNG
jgi:septum site-determining protein MinC